MDAAGHRFGNFYRPVGIPERMDMLTYNNVDSMFGQFGAAYEGIPITTERLERFTFALDDRGYHIEPTIRMHIKRNEDREGFWYVRIPGMTLAEYEFIHQIQNLYYSIKGNELPLKK